MHRILEESVRITAEERDYNLSLRLVPVIPSLRGQHFAAKPISLVSLGDKDAISTSGLLESYGVTEEDAARACVKTVEQFLQARNKIATA